MKNKLISTVASFGILFTLASSTSFAKTEKCQYDLDKSSVSVGWTAYKTNQKVGVNGTFKQVDVQGKLSADSMTALLKGLNVSVSKESVDSGNPGRDKTLVDFFFAKLQPPTTASIKSVSEKDHTFVMALTLNAQTHDVTMHYDNKDQAFTATGEIDILNFAGKEALASLADKCKDLHKGSDGVSKTWSTVTVNLKGNVKKECK